MIDCVCVLFPLDYIYSNSERGEGVVYVCRKLGVTSHRFNFVLTEINLNFQPGVVIRRIVLELVVERVFSRCDLSTVSSALRCT